VRDTSRKIVTTLLEILSNISIQRGDSASPSTNVSTVIISLRVDRVHGISSLLPDSAKSNPLIYPEVTRKKKDSSIE